MGCLYRITAPNGKSYIGITSKTLEDRWKVHLMRAKEGRSQALQRAIMKYGADTFKIESLVIADDWQYLCELEKLAIAAFDTRSPNGYNLTVGGEGVVGRVHTEAASKNMSAGQRKRVRTQSDIDRLIAEAKKYWDSERGMSIKAAAAERKMKKIEEKRATWAARHSSATKAAMARPEVAQKVKAAARARAADPEWRKKISASKKGVGIGVTRSAETKAKMAEARRQWWAKKRASSLQET